MGWCFSAISMRNLHDYYHKQMESAILNQREKEILRLIAAGNTTRQIAEAISLSPDTIKWYRKRLIAKIGAANSVEMVRKALEMNIL